MNPNNPSPKKQTFLQPSKPLKIFFHSVDGVGHMNACIGLGQALTKRGHQIYFLLNESFKGQFEKFGFTEILLKFKHELVEPEQAENQKPKNVIKEFAENLILSGFLSDKSPYEKLKAQMESENSLFEIIYRTMVAFEPQIESALEREKPNVIIIDSAIVSPAVLKSNIPWMANFSVQPLCVYKSDKLPPAWSGFPVDSDPSTWKEFRVLMPKYYSATFGKYRDKLHKEFNYQAPSDFPKEQFDLSPHLNIYGYPDELDYHDVAPRPDKFVNLEAFSREVPEAFQVPEKLGLQSGDKLIYVSLGSMGSIDVDLMKRIVAVLAKTAHKYIVSKGPRGDEYELPANCCGDVFLPQTRILPLVDLVITHGGNNTTTETFAQGKPMIVLPLFGDQYDNAQRVHEKKYGIRLEPYSFTESELLDAISQLLHDTELQRRLRLAKERIRQSNGKDLVCRTIEQVVAQFQDLQKS